MSLEFEHRPSDLPSIERVWRSRSRGSATMASVARAHGDLVFWEDRDGRHAGVQGPESRASAAPVPADASFLGVRLALGSTLAGMPPALLVDRFAPLPVDGDRFVLGGNVLRIPAYEDAEAFVAMLLRRGLLTSSPLGDDAGTDRTRQRHYREAVGLPRRTVRQIERAHDAALRLRDGQPPADAAVEAGYFDQPHLARSLRRFIGPTATDLLHGDGAPLSLLYKTRRDPGR